MAAVAVPEKSTVLRNSSWEDFERLVAKRGDRGGTRFAYCDGDLEIVAPSADHEDISRTLASLVEIAAVEPKTDPVRRGSTTYTREDFAKGFEPDSSYYFRHAPAWRGKPEIDLRVDPAPELVIEIDVSRNSLDRFAIDRAIGVQEI